MNIMIIAVGKDSTPTVLELQQTYEKRLKPYVSVEWKLLPQSRFTEPLQIRDDESTALLGIIKPNDTVILLDERGLQQTNEEFAKTYERLSGSHGRLIFIIGGAYGVNDLLRSRSSFVWSLSNLIFPHQLVRVILLEQIYRTYMVMHNHPYHHN